MKYLHQKLSPLSSFVFLHSAPGGNEEMPEPIFEVLDIEPEIEKNLTNHNLKISRFFPYTLSWEGEELVKFNNPKKVHAETEKDNPDNVTFVCEYEPDREYTIRLDMKNSKIFVNGQEYFFPEKKDENGEYVYPKEYIQYQALTKKLDQEMQDKKKQALYAMSPDNKNKTGIELMYDPEFIDKVNQVCAAIGANPKDLITVMLFETKGTLNPAIQNGIGATGLIQFMPKTAKKDLGTSVEALKRMSAVQQLEYVQKYYEQFSSIATKSVENLYLATIYPYSLNKSLDYVVGSEKGESYAKKFARQNPVFRRKGAKTVSKKDILRVIQKRAEGSGIPSHFNTLS